MDAKLVEGFNWEWDQVLKGRQGGGWEGKYATYGQYGLLPRVGKRKSDKDKHTLRDGRMRD